MKKLFFVPLVFLFAACSQVETPTKADAASDCGCTHTECPCPNNCAKCFCNQK